MSTRSRATRGVEQNKASSICGRMVEASYERAERLDDNYRYYTLFVVAGDG